MIRRAISPRLATRTLREHVGSGGAGGPNLGHVESLRAPAVRPGRPAGWPASLTPGPSRRSFRSRCRPMRVVATISWRLKLGGAEHGVRRLAPRGVTVEPAADGDVIARDQGVTQGGGGGRRSSGSGPARGRVSRRMNPPPPRARSGEQRRGRAARAALAGDAAAGGEQAARAGAAHAVARSARRRRGREMREHRARPPRCGGARPRAQRARMRRVGGSYTGLALARWRS